MNNPVLHFHKQLPHTLDFACLVALAQALSNQVNDNYHLLTYRNLLMHHLRTCQLLIAHCRGHTCYCLQDNNRNKTLPGSGLLRDAYLLNLMCEQCC